MKKTLTWLLTGGFYFIANYMIYILIAVILITKNQEEKNIWFYAGLFFAGLAVLSFTLSAIKFKWFKP